MAEIKVKVTNIGLDKLEMPSWSSPLTVKQSGREPLMGPICYRRSIRVDYRTTTLDKSDALNVKASVTYEDDLDPDNNEVRGCYQLHCS